MNKIICKTSELLAESFISYLKRMVDEKGLIYVALSGGSTPDIVFNMLRESDDVSWMDSIHFFWVDERMVPYEDCDSNFGKARRIFFSHSLLLEENIHPIPFVVPENRAAEQYEDLLDSLVPKFKGLPRFDLVVLGLGEDGHTASIFPDAIELWNSEKLCEVAEHPMSGQKRVTLTGGVINNAKHICFLVAGSSKSKVLKDIEKKRNGFEKYPASLVDYSDDKLVWFVDEDANS